MKYCLAIIVLLITTFSHADTQKIAAVVNDELVTLQEFQARRKMLIALSGGADHANKMIDKAALETLIEERLLGQQADKLGLKVTDEEVANAIANIEHKNKLAKGQFLAQLQSKGVELTSFRAKIRTEILKSKLVSETLSRGMTVSPSEVEAVVLGTNFKDANLNLSILTAKTNSDAAYSKMTALAKKLPKSCAALQGKSYKDFADEVSLSIKLSELDPQIQTVVKNMTTGDHSDVIKVGDNLKIVMVCSKKIENFTNEETNYVINFLANKKLGLKAQKYMEDLRKRAYIKILI